MKTKGFTLVEMAVVLIIVSAVSGMLISGFATFMHHMYGATTNARQVAIKDALISYLRDDAHKRLPCPATKDDGAEDCSKWSGTVPYRELSLPQEEARDAWGNYFTYVVSPDWRTGSTLRKNTPGSVVVNNDTAAAAVVISHGANGDGATNVQYRPNASPPVGSVEETANAAGCSPQCYRTGPADTFDDRVLALSPQTVLEPLLQQGWKDQTETDCDSVAAFMLQSSTSNGDGTITLSFPMPPNACSKGTYKVGLADCGKSLPACSSVCVPGEYVCRVLMNNGAFK